MTDALDEFEKGDRVRCTRTRRLGFVIDPQENGLIHVEWDDGRRQLTQQL